MARVTDTGGPLRTFVAEVIEAAEPNAEEVVPVVLAVAGGILAVAEPASIAREETDEGAGGVLWASFGGERMAFRYNPMTAMIELRSGDLEEHPKRWFGRRSLPMDILNFFGPSRAAEAARTRP